MSPARLTVQMPGFDQTAFIRALSSVLPPGKQPLALHEPRFAGNEWKYLKECLDTGWVSSAGKFVDRFESDLAAYTGSATAVAVVNGTAALHSCLLLAGVRPEDEVLVPALSFVATANAVAYCGAVPHFVDSEESTLGVDPSKLAAHLQEIADRRPEGCYNRRTGRRISSLVVMHTFGHPVDLDGAAEVSGRFGLELIEDAAESLGSFYRGKHTGQWGRLSALSFNGNKLVTSGGGGAILTNDAQLGQMAKHLTTTARLPHRWKFVHDRVGYNYRLPNINAALGCAQLEQLPSMLESKRRLAEKYRNAFAHLPGVRFVSEPRLARSNYWLNAVLLDAPSEEAIDSLLGVTNDLGYMTRPAWTLLHRLPMYAECPRADLTVAEALEKRIVNLPSSAHLADLGD